MAATTSTPGRFGAALMTPTTTTLAAMSARNLTPGTLCWVIELEQMFRLETSDASLVPDEVVAVLNITGARWIVQPELTAADIAMLATVEAGNNLCQTYVSEEIDFAVLNDEVTAIPARAGFYATIINHKILFTAVGGALGAAGTVKLGNDASLNNGYGSSGTGINSSTIATQFAAGAGTSVLVSTTSGLNFPRVDLTTPFTLRVTVANNGAAVVLKGVAEITYSLTPIPT